MSEIDRNFGHNWKPDRKTGSGATYAITFDLDTTTLEATYGGASWRNAYSDIRNVLDDFGFDRQQGSVCFGGAGVDAVTCGIAVQELTAKFPWFAPSMRDIRMLRIEDNNDLRPAMDRAAKRRR